MQINQHPDTIDDWNPAIDEGLQPPVPNTLGSDEIPPGVINSVEAKPNGSGVYIHVRMVDPEDDSLTPVVRHRLHDDGSGSPGPWIEQPNPDPTHASGFIGLNTGLVPTDSMLDVEAGFIGSNDSYGPWSTTEEVTSTVDPTPAGPVTGVSVSPGHLTATINWTGPNSSNYIGSRIYWNTVNTFSSASAVSPPEYGAPGSFDTRAITLTAGVRYAWVVSLNRSGLEGTPVATGAFTVT